MVLDRARAVADRLARRAWLALPLEQAAVLDGRPYWRVGFTDGSAVDERQEDWPNLRRAGRKTLTLVAPDGTAQTIDAGAAGGDRLLQFKTAVVAQRLALAAPGVPITEGQPPDADGITTVRTRPPTPEELREARILAHAPTRRTTAYVIGLLAAPDGTCECLAWEPAVGNPRAGRWRAVRDNVHRMAYQHAGRLAPERLGLVAP